MAVAVTSRLHSVRAATNRARSTSGRLPLTTVGQALEAELVAKVLLLVQNKGSTSARSPGDVEGQSVAKKTMLVHKTIIYDESIANQWLDEPRARRR